MVKYITVVDDGVKKTSEIIKDIRKVMCVEIESYMGLSEDKIDDYFPQSKTSRKFKVCRETKDNISQYNLRNGITFREALIYTFQYYKETGKHTDCSNSTLCVGSPTPNGLDYILLHYNTKKDQLETCWISAYDNLQRKYKTRLAIEKRPH